MLLRRVFDLERCDFYLWPSFFTLAKHLQRCVVVAVGTKPLSRHSIRCRDDNRRTKMLRGFMLATAMTGGVLLSGSAVATAAPKAPAQQSLMTQSLIEKTQYRYCRRWYRECRARWGAGRDFRRCMRRHGC
jgi:hypothetical protein